MKRSPSRSKEATRERIVDVAARAIRCSGYHGTGVADIMKAAGLTHGGFYAHFPSRDALLAEAADRAGLESVQSLQNLAAGSSGPQALQAMIHGYLSKGHLENVEVGCHFASLATEMPRQVPEVRHAATRRLKEGIDLIARQFSDWGSQAAHERALVTMATMVGTMAMARAVDDPALSDALREAAIKHLDQISH
jgi:TetR/AcrR family transcriptional repressor of nem operon